MSRTSSLGSLVVFFAAIFGVLYCNKSRPDWCGLTRVMPLQKKVGAKHKRTLAHIVHPSNLVRTGSSKWPSQALTVTVRSLKKVCPWWDGHHSRGRVVWCLTRTSWPSASTVYCCTVLVSTTVPDQQTTVRPSWRAGRSTRSTILRCEAR